MAASEKTAVVVTGASASLGAARTTVCPDRHDLVLVAGITMKLSLQSLRASPRSVMRIIAGRLNRPV